VTAVVASAFFAEVGLDGGNKSDVAGGALEDISDSRRDGDDNSRGGGGEAEDIALT
jgi:hypothetical protein